MAKGDNPRRAKYDKNADVIGYNLRLPANIHRLLNHRSGDCKMYVDDNNYGHSPCYYHLRILLFSCHGEKAKVRTAARFLRVGFALSTKDKNRHHKTDAGPVKIA